MASNPNPFASDSSGLSRMLQAAFAAMPQGGGQLKYMGMPDTSQPRAQEPIDLGAGGPPPGSERGNWLSSLGNIAQTVAPMVGGAMSAGGAKSTTQGAGGWSNSALGNQPNITAPQLGTPQNFSTPNLNLSLNPSAPRPLFTFRG